MDVEARAVRRVSRRLLPLLITCYFISYLDRVNVGFAALTMNEDLGISATAYGLGAGIFFLTYFVFEVPSNLILERVGARVWIARIMLTWGLLSGAMAFVVGETSFYAVRLLLGAAEAGFFPGIIFYLTLWFPARYRGRIIGTFMVAVPLSSVVGAPVSGALLGLDGVWGFRGWQWLYVLEALPAVICAGIVLGFLTDRPAQAAWLPADERAWLTERLAQERRARESARRYSVRDALLDRRVLAVAFVYFGNVALLYGLSFFLPQIVKGFDLTNVQTGLVSLIPFAIGIVGMLALGRSSDRRGERKGHAAFALLLAAGGTAGAALISDPYAKMVLFSVSAFGVFGGLPVIWTLPTAFLSGAAAAGGIAIVNALGNLSGFAAPYAVGAIKDATGTFTGGLLLIAAAGLAAMVTVLCLTHDPHLEQAAARGAQAAE
ncbi:membrane protein [Methylobacterium radiotolerans]|nr:membrane protein [Methylobacterium radiotolerans]KTS48639.1 membrane protein [Methylobacterium radiotolerans]